MPDTKQAFVQRIHPHQGLIRSLCAAYFPVEEDRKDAFQDVLLQLWKSHATFREQSSFATWIYKVALHTLLDKVKRQRRMPTCAYRPEYEWVDPSVQESTELIHFALDRLAPADKALVALYLEGYRYQEIAELSDLTTTNVSTRLNRIRRKLKAILTRELVMELEELRPHWKTYRTSTKEEQPIRSGIIRPATYRSGISLPARTDHDHPLRSGLRVLVFLLPGCKGCNSLLQLSRLGKSEYGDGRCLRIPRLSKSLYARTLYTNHGTHRFAYVFWNPDPVLIDVGFYELRWYGLLFATGIVLSYVLVQRGFRRAGLSDAVFDTFAASVVLGMFLGMRLGHFLFYEPMAFVERPLEVLLPVSFDPTFHFTGYQGLASHGGVIGILVAVGWLVRKHRPVSGWFVFNQLAIVGSLAGGFIRLGNLMNSEIIGQPTEVPWAFVFVPVDTLPRHPTPLYEAVGYFAIFALLYGLRQRPWLRRRGRLLGLFLVLLFGLRFGVEFFKENQEAFEQALWLNMGQLLSIPFIVAGIIILILSHRAVPQHSG